MNLFSIIFQALVPALYMAATHDITQGGAMQPHLSGTKYTAQRLIDFTAIQPAAADVIQCIPVKEGMYVTDVRLMVVVAAGATCTCDLGDGADPNGFDDSVNLNASAKTVTIGVTGTDDYITNGRLYVEDDTIDMVVDNTNSTGKYLLMVDFIYIENTTVHSTL